VRRWRLFEAVEKLPELGGDGLDTLRDQAVLDEVPDVPEDEVFLPPAPGEELPKFPLLSAAAAELPLYVVGGVAVDAKVEWINRLGIRTEWLGAKDNDVTIGKVVGRVRSKSVCAVILLHELMGHGQTTPAAARAAGLPCISGRKGGQGQLLAAFGQIEEWLGRRSS